MAVTGFLPRREYGPDCNGLFLTFVVPAPDGCNLACPFCLVQQRHEWTPDHFISVDDLALFVRQTAERKPIAALAIQGYEPLLPGSLPHTTALLTTGKQLGVPAGLVTNGVLLAEAIDALSEAAPDAIAVSLDAGSADQHDRIRGVSGAWAAAVLGLEQAATRLPPWISLVVSSVLQPGKRRYLDALPARLRHLGVDYWIVNPLLRISRNGKSGLVDSADNIFRDLLVLQDAADRAGVGLIVDDEFDLLRHRAASMHEPALRPLHVRTRPPGVEILRLAPNGQCSFGHDILRQVTPDTPRWRPDRLNAGEFIDLVRRDAHSGAAEPFRPSLHPAAFQSGESRVQPHL